MKRYEYEISTHLADSFKELSYFCSSSGKCELNEVPGDHLAILTDILNKRGARGWELTQLFFDKSGVVIFWRRESAAPVEIPEIMKV